MSEVPLYHQSCRGGAAAQMRVVGVAVGPSERAREQWGRGGGCFVGFSHISEAVVVRTLLRRSYIAEAIRILLRRLWFVYC